MFFKSKKIKKELIAPVSGKIIPIEEVKDPVFAQKMMGDGFAIQAEDSIFCAPADGKITAIFPSNHAFGITLDDGLEILVHIGLDTVNENGRGFSCPYKLGDVVKAKDSIITIDRTYLLEKGYDLTTMIIFTNAQSYKSFACEYGTIVKGKEDVVATYQ